MHCSLNPETNVAFWHLFLHVSFLPQKHVGFLCAAARGHNGNSCNTFNWFSCHILSCNYHVLYILYDRNSQAQSNRKTPVPSDERCDSFRSTPAVVNLTIVGLSFCSTLDLSIIWTEDGISANTKGDNQVLESQKSTWRECTSRCLNVLFFILSIISKCIYRGAQWVPTQMFHWQHAIWHVDSPVHLNA